MILQSEINKAVEILRVGGLVAMPTETVYGLAADARQAEAVRKIFTVKQRPASHPLIVHISDLAQIGDWALETPKEADKLAKAFWPGPLTLILKARPEVLKGVTGGQDTVALRIPRHPVAQALLTAFGSGLVAPSANRFTRISPTTAAAVEAELGGQIDYILDGGASEVGLESTILDLSSDYPRILRPGMISADEISRVLGVNIMRQECPSEIKVPGMHHLHYSPITPARQFTQALPTFDVEQLPIACMTYTDIQLPSHSGIHQVNMPANPAAYAKVLYAVLRQQDQQQFKYIFIESVPDAVEWDAIRDRLAKACGIT